MKRALTSHGFASIVGGSLLWCALYGARVVYSGRFVFGFLVWNLFLAWVPWILALGLERAVVRRWRFVAIGLALAWVLFLPNAPYVITDFVHLHPRHPVPLWFDVFLLGTASLTGLLAGAFSLRRVEEAIECRLSPSARALGLGLTIALSGFGIYLGRFERWNSWDLLLHPLELVKSLLHVPSLRAVVVTAACAGLLGVTFLAVRDVSVASRR